MIRELLVLFFLLAGGFFSIVAAIGLIRLPDLYARMHAATKSGTVGVSAIAIAMMVHFNTPSVTARGLLVIAFFLLTAPVAAHMIGRAAYRTGVPLWLMTRIDEYNTHGKCEEKMPSTD